jgi:hypothetical protein
MTPVETIRRIAPLFQLELRFASQFSVFVCIARIFLIGIPVELWRRENCVHESIRSNHEWHNGNADRLIAYGRACAKISSGFSFCFLSDTRASFSSQENFWPP